MRDYAKISPKFWTGETGQELAKRGPEALVVALYLMTSPHSNMLGIYRLPVLYMSEETGLSPEGATKGLQDCMEAGFCDYDPQTKIVWVIEMARWQISEALASKDLRCKGIQKDYNALPNIPFLGRFFDYYEHKFHLTDRREFVVKTKGVQLQLVSPLQAPSKPGAGEGEGEGTRAGAVKPSASSAAKLPPCPLTSIVELYHQALPELPEVRLMPTKRRRAIAKIWDWTFTSRKPDNTRRAETPEQAIEWFQTYFARVRNNEFLMGKTPRIGEHANWQCDLDFLLTDKGMAHVIEKTREIA